MRAIRFGQRKRKMHKPFAKIFHSDKKQLNNQAPLAQIYAGDWQFTDENNFRVHHLHIKSDLAIALDKRALPGSVLRLSERELVFLDTYGYHLRIDAIDGHPISVYDEADNRVYQLSPCDSSSKD